ncbi:P2X purinoceptor 7-like [Dermacentor variabilis]|uniref:P2X purinoceptor 7-like n=1 Tax=Dermacentor variabilis TaxID=34621 RepID=UPI003F5AE0A1
MSEQMGFDPYSDTPFRNLLLHADDGSSDSPPPDSPSSPDGPDDDNDHRCDCRLCEHMPTALEQVCCRDVPQVVAESPEACITQHEEFRSVSLSPAVLGALYWELQENGVVVDGEVHRKYRFLAYRLFSRWIWKRLGRRNRVVLPACVVSAIRRKFPSAEYVGFRYPPL